VGNDGHGWSCPIHPQPLQLDFPEGPIQRLTPERDRLWEQFQDERTQYRSVREEHLQSITDQRREYLRGVFADIRKPKQEAKSSAILDWRQKKRVYAALQVERLKALEKARLMYGRSRSRELVDNRYPGLTWTAFLQREAEKGDAAAVMLLRQGKGKSIHDQANYKGRASEEEPICQGMKYQVDKRGRSAIS